MGRRCSHDTGGAPQPRPQAQWHSPTPIHRHWQLVASQARSTGAGEGLELSLEEAGPFRFRIVADGRPMAPSMEQAAASAVVSCGRRVYQVYVRMSIHESGPTFNHVIRASVKSKGDPVPSYCIRITFRTPAGAGSESGASSSLERQGTSTHRMALY